MEEDTRMTPEQLKEFVEVLSVLSAKSSVIKERDELRALMEENQQTASEEAEVRLFPGLTVVQAIFGLQLAD
jgi:tRNA A37 threonylcarbamoyladenosine dehydratase